MSLQIISNTIKNPDLLQLVYELQSLNELDKLVETTENTLK